MHSQFGEDILYMIAGSRVAYGQSLGDRAVSFSLSEEAQHLFFSLGQFSWWTKPPHFSALRGAITRQLLGHAP